MTTWIWPDKDIEDAEQDAHAERGCELVEALANGKAGTIAFDATDNPNAPLAHAEALIIAGEAIRQTVTAKRGEAQGRKLLKAGDEAARLATATHLRECEDPECVVSKLAKEFGIEPNGPKRPRGSMLMESTFDSLKRAFAEGKVELAAPAGAAAIPDPN